MAIRIVVLLLLLALFAGGLTYFVRRIRRGKRPPGMNEKGADFRPRIGFTHMDGGESVALLLNNKSDEHVWTEEIEISLTDLVADDQTSEASCREIQKIRQTISMDEVLPISLVEVIYKAAGKPQREYSCVLSSIVRYRVGDKLFEEPLNSYRLSMIGLTVDRIRRERKTVPTFKPPDESQDLRAMGASPK